MDDQSIPSRVQYWLTEARHDCHFLVGPEDGPTERIGVVKTFLLGYSEVFRAMLQDSELAERGDVRLKDVNPETFRNFLKYIYGAGNTVLNHLSFEKCTNLLYMVEKYLVNEIKLEIVQKLLSLFTFDDIFFSLLHPVLFENDTTKAMLMSLVKENFDKIMLDDRFLQLNEIGVIRFLQMRSIHTLKEKEIWNLIVQWGKRQSNSDEGTVIRPHVYNVLKYIRFPNMDFTDFWTLVVESKILNDEEVYDICKSFGTGNPPSMPHLCDDKFKKIREGLVSSNVTSTFIERPKYALIHWVINNVDNNRPLLAHLSIYQWAGYAWFVCLKLDDRTTRAAIKVYGRATGWKVTANVELSFISFNDNPSRGVKKVFSFQESTPTLDLPLPQDFFSNPQNKFVNDNTAIMTVQLFLKEESNPIIVDE